MNSVVRRLPLNDDVTPDSFRAAMRHLTGGVSVLTVGREHDISGMTVTSVSSLSTDPPSIIVSINQQSSSWQLLQRYRSFGVSILRGDQLDVAERFSGVNGLKGIERFSGARWISGASGVPLLTGALASFDCEIEDTIERHSHAIVIGLIRELRSRQKDPALAYWQGQYVAVDRDDDAAKLADVCFPTSRALWEV